MKIRMFEDDPRYLSEPFEQFFNNCGSFSAIIHELNRAFGRLGVLAATEEEADIVGFSSGLKLDFGLAHKKRFLIGVWESNILPQFLVVERTRLEKAGNYRYFGLSKQISDVWESYGFPTKTIDLGVDTEFWKSDPNTQKFDKFTFLSVTACNFRSGIFNLISAYVHLGHENQAFKEGTQLIIKNTDERATKLPMIVANLRSYGFNITYLLKRTTRSEVRDLYDKSHVLAYVPIHTSGGIPILEAASMELPCIVPDYSPTNLYPHTNTVEVASFPIAAVKHELTRTLSLPYNFPEGAINEDAALIHLTNPANFKANMISLYNDYEKHKAVARTKREEVARNWTWDKSAEKLVEIFSAG